MPANVRLAERGEPSVTVRELCHSIAARRNRPPETYVVEIVQWGRLADHLGRAPTPREYAREYHTTELDAATRLADFQDAFRGVSPIEVSEVVASAVTARGLVLDEVKLVLE
jgi:hypothetical protein